MKIKEFAYWDKEIEWTLETVNFSNLSLLVGVSGVGKTQILRAILNLQKIARGASLNGVGWKVTFLDNNNAEYQWLGEFETQKDGDEIIIEKDEAKEEKEFKFIEEKLVKNGQLIVERKSENIRFKNTITPKLSPYKSVVELLNQEEEIAPVQEAFKKIIYRNHSISETHPLETPVGYRVDLAFKLEEKYSSLEAIRESNLPMRLKLSLINKHSPEMFNKIKSHFRDIFEQVEDVTIKPDPDVPEFFAAIFPVIQIKEKGVKKWIDQERISSGMLKTLAHIADLYLSPEGTVILIDEFENSLGINCIDMVTEDLLGDNRSLQFIITSHHPYIINNIGMEHWKIVTRYGGVVTVKDAKDYPLGNSRHQGFIQLMNLAAYKEGIAY